MADDTAPDGEGEKKPDATAQMDLFAERTEKVAEQLEATASHMAVLAERAASAPPPAPSGSPAPPTKPVRYSEERIVAAIERKEITQAEGMALIALQIREEAKEEARKEAAGALAQNQSQERDRQIAAKIGEFRQAIPGLAQQGSPEWRQVVQRFQELVAEGHDKSSLLTELTALRDVFGRNPARQEVREVTRDRVARTVETPSASGGGSRGTGARGGGRERSPENDPDLPEHVRGYLAHQIQLGQLKGWDDPKAKSYAARYKKMRGGAAA